MADLKKKTRFRELTAKAVRWTCDAKRIHKPQSKRKLRAVKAIGTVGQDRALKALRMGITMDSPGYNVFVCGQAGTGKTSAVKAVLGDIRKPAWSKTSDRCYVHNFGDPSRPKLLTFVPGEGARFKHDMDEFVDMARRNIPRALDSDVFRKKRGTVVEAYQEKEKALVEGFEKQVRKKNFVLVQFQDGANTRQDVLPLVDGKPSTLPQLTQLIEEGKLKLKDVERLNKVYVSFQPKLARLLKKRRQLAKDVYRKLEALEREAALEAVEELLDEMRESFAAHKDVQEYLDDLVECVLSDLELFKAKDEEQAETEGKARGGDPFIEYRVNLLHTHDDPGKVPVIMETHPSFRNLVGTIERAESGGHYRTDHMGIRAGSLLRADGGFLVLNAADVFTDPRVWAVLKTMLKHRTLEIHEPEFMLLTNPSALKPEPIKLNLKVIMIGESWFYNMASSVDEDFAKIFKVKAEFDSEMKLSRSNLDHFVGVVSRITEEEGLLKPDKSALSYLTEWAMREAGTQGKLSTKFSEIANFLREADYVARAEKKRSVNLRHMKKALFEKIARSDLYEQRILEMMEEGTIFIDVKGERVGQINGLAVYTIGRFSFGKPSRLSASVGLGREGLINIEREAGMSGRIHDKGVLILEGLFRNRYARNHPLSMTASLCFEQSYSGVDGDSASSTEAYALMSALSGLPIRQDIAVTGSINQAGEVQPIGGANEKIEGFYKVCQILGFTGKQGVIIPASNAINLMLAQEVVEAIEAGRFHIWPVKTVDEGIEILTGVTAGTRRKDGSYTPGSVNALVDARLREMAVTLARFNRMAFED